MPVTKTAKRALRGSIRKGDVNKKILSSLEVSLRLAKKGRKEKDIRLAVSLTDRAAKKHAIHKNKAARIKSSLSKLLPKTNPKKKSVTPKTKKK